MTDYFYVTPVYSYGGPQLRGSDCNWGSVTKDPVAAYKRYWSQHTRRMKTKHNVFPLDRAGRTFAAWRLPYRMPLDAARPYAHDNPPYRVYVVLSNDGWNIVDLILPEGKAIDFGFPRAEDSS